jgi:hypothetical protein
MSGACGTHGRQEKCLRVLVDRPEGKRPLGRPGHGWEDNIKVNLQAVGWRGMDWIDLADDRDT